MALLLGFFFAQNAHELVIQKFVLVQIRPDELVDALAAEPLRDTHHLLWLHRGEFEVDDADDVPVIVNEDVTLVQIG